MEGILAGIRTRVREVQRRMLLFAAASWALRGLFYALLGLTILALVDRLVYLDYDLRVLIPFVIAVPLLVGPILAWGRRASLLRAAIAADEQLNVQERLSSALALDTARTPMEQALVHDAQRWAERLPLTAAARFRAPWEAKWAPLPLLACLAVFLFCPQWDLFGRAAEKEELRQEIAQVQKKAERLKKMSEEFAKAAKAEELKTPQKLAQEMERLSEEFEKGLPQKDALAKLTSLTDEIKQRRTELGPKIDMAKDLQDMFGPDKQGLEGMEKKLSQGAFGEAAKMLEQIQKDLKDGNLSETQKENLRRMLEKLGQRMKDNPNLSKLAEKLQKAMNELGEKDYEKLAKALKSLQNDMQQLEADLNEYDMLDMQEISLEDLKFELTHPGEHVCKKCGRNLEPFRKGQDGLTSPEGGDADQESDDWEALTEERPEEEEDLTAEEEERGEGEQGEDGGEEAQVGEQGDQGDQGENGQPGEQAGGEQGQDGQQGDQAGGPRGGKKPGDQAGGKKQGGQQAGQKAGSKGGKKTAGTQGAGKGQGAEKGKGQGKGSGGGEGADDGDT